ncbi:hypothetical protein JNW90_28655 [Micromonospora sp. STR1s_5]|nr:hypothetical protein [Micromonospora sp. STR1s_5]
MALPIPALQPGEYRALTWFDAVPLDCGTVPVEDDRFAPHLKRGEFAVIDPEDREPLPGEIFVVKISSPARPEGYRLRIVQLRTKVCSVGTEQIEGRWIFVR